MTNYIAVAASLVSLVACGGGADDTSDPPLFPEDYAATYTEVRNCRASIEHGPIRIRVMASPEALGPYTDRVSKFPTGAIVLKEQYDDGDTACAGPILEYTVMQKLDVGSATAELDWAWQEVTASTFKTKTIDAGQCVACHKDCITPPDGYDGTCTTP
ncbi:MAG TPA: cytochrome P460 family protein [Kofleriaceae bacterium]|nr:cytochrome P460 family protein [Kofleriaceae bacterium]